MYYSDPMDQDGVYTDNVQQTQQETQPTTQSSQPSQPEWDTRLWGFFVPCRKPNKRIDCFKELTTIRIGRFPSQNDIVLDSPKISNKHCTLHWDGKEDSSSIVTVKDLSSNGTYINGTRVGKNMTSILREGDEIGFGVWHGGDDHRYSFRFTAGGPPRQGIYAHYDVGHELGHGSFATVRSAILRDTGAMYAVKIVHRSRFRTGGPMSKETFMREISILKRLKHKNICTLKETFEDDQSIYLVLEYVDGGDLLDYIIARRGLPELEAQQLTAQLCEALAYIHSEGIAHRDLKPENVLLTKSVPPVLKVADFGLAKAVDSMTNFKTTCGTPCYLAPEVVLRDPEQGYDHMVDSWSVGVIVFSMISNASPFIEVSSDHIKQRFSNRRLDWTPFDDVGPSDEAYDFVVNLLKKDPKKRMSAAESLIHPWIAPFVSFPEALSQSQSHSQPLRRPESLTEFIDTVPLDDESMLLLDAAGHPGPADDGTTPTPTPGAAVQAGVDHEVEHVRMDEVEEAVPLNQNQAVRQPLKSRAAALAENDPDGQMQSFELVVPSERGGAGTNEKRTSITDGASARTNGKRKARADDDDHDMGGGSDSSLTPVEDDEDELQLSPINATKAGKAITKSTKKSRASRAATGGVRKTRARRGAGAG